MQIVSVPAGTSLEQLQAQTGLSETALQELCPRQQLKDGAFRSAFDIAVPAQYALARTAPEALAPEPEHAALAVRAQTKAVVSQLEATKGELRGVMREARAYAGTWSRQAQAAKSVFNRPGLPGGRQLDRARRIADTLLAGFDAHADIFSRLQSMKASLPEAARDQARDASKAVDRLQPELRMALETVFNALPKMLDVTPPSNSYRAYRGMIDKGDVPGLRDVFEDMHTRASQLQAAQDSHGAGVASSFDHLRNATGRWFVTSTKLLAPEAHKVGAPKDFDAVRRAFDGAKAAFDELDAAVKPAQDQLAKLSGVGTERLTRQLSEAIERAEATPLRLLREVVNRARSILDVHDVIPSGDIGRADRETLEAAFEGIFARATDVQTAQEDFGVQVRDALTVLNRAHQEAMRPVEQGTDPAKVWSAAKAVSSHVRAAVAKSDELLATLAKTPGARRLHYNLKSRRDQLTAHAGAGALATGAKRLRGLYALTFADHKSEGEISKLAKANNVASLDAYQQSLATIAADLVKATAEHGPAIEALEGDADALKDAWSKTLLGDLKGVTADDVRGRWSAIADAPEQLAGLEARAQAFAATFESLGHAGTPLAVRVSNAHSGAKTQLAGLLEKAPKLLSEALGLPYAAIPREGLGIDVARGLDFEAMAQIIETITESADRLGALREQHGDKIAAVTQGLKDGLQAMRSARSSKNPARLAEAIQTVTELGARRQALLDGPLSAPEAGNLRGPVYRADPKFELQGAQRALEELQRSASS